MLPKKKIKIISLIPAKKISKGLKGKNLKKLNKLSLVELAIISSLKCKLIDQTYVSSNCKKIQKLSKKYKIDTLKRKESLSTSKSTANQVIFDFITFYKKQDINYKNSIIVYLQPTSPFRNHMHINEAIKKFLYSKKTTLISVTKTKNFFKTFKINKKNLVTFFKDKNLSSNRQNLSTIYQSNGAIYIFYIKEFLKKKKINYKNFAYYEMNFISSIDIDNKEDYNLAKKLSDDIIYKKEINYSL